MTIASPGDEREEPVENLTHLLTAHLMDQVLGVGVVDVAETVVSREDPGLEQQVPGRHVGVAVDEVDVGNVAVVHGPDLSLDRSDARLVNEPEPDHGQDVEGVPEREERSPASDLTPAQHGQRAPASR